MPNLTKPIAQIPKDVGEAVVKPAVDEAMKVLNDIPAAIFGTPNQRVSSPTPINPSQQADEEKRKQNIIAYFNALKANATAYKQQEDFIKQQRTQKALAEEQKVRQFDIQAKQKRDETVF